MLFLYSRNIAEYPEDTILAPLLIALLFTAIVFTITRFIFKNTAQAAIVSSVIVFICLSYSRFLTLYTNISVQLGSFVISHDVIVFILCVAVITVSIYGVIRFKTSLDVLNQLFIVLALVLLIFPISSIVSFETKTQRILKIDFTTGMARKEAVVQSEKTPDIYYIIFDRYAGPKSLNEQYAYDNSNFFTFLKDKGFYLAEDASTNYPKTFLSLASSLNFEYINYLTDKTNGGASPDESIVTPLIRNNKAIAFLKKKGYSYIHIGPVWTPTSTNPNADKNYTFKDGLYPNADAFTTGFLNQTIAAPVFKNLFKDTTAVSKDPENNDHRKRIFFELNAIKDASTLPGPKFVFMHILIPHDPFVVDKNCQPISEAVVGKNDHVTNYLNQLHCANTQVEDMISTILKNSKTPPVIILQSDEGPFPMKEPISKDQGWAQASDVSLREKFPILNAYLFPGKKKTELYPSITPVNSFRVLFNTYFGTKYPLLPDKNYVFQDQNNYYKFTEVTDRLK